MGLEPRRRRGGALTLAGATLASCSAGSGRDAAWLAGLGHDVVAVEPAPAMRAEATRRYSQAGVRWIADSLPALAHPDCRAIAW